MTWDWLSALSASLAAAVGLVASRSGEEDDPPVDSDGNSVRVSAGSRDEAYLVLGWSRSSPPSNGKLVIANGSAAFPADSRLTIYRLVPVGRWPGPNAEPHGIRCREVFEDCPVPPPPGPPPGPPPINPGEELQPTIVRFPPP
jgi:hypothetical protein